MLYRKLYPFEYQEAKSVSEAVSILNDYGPEAAIMAGGVSLVDEMKRRLVTPKAILSIQPINELKYIGTDRGTLCVGALASLAQGEKSSTVKNSFHSLWHAISQIASVQVRNMGTIVGNITACNPGSDVATAMVSLGATVEVTDKTGQKSIPVEAFGIHSRKSVLGGGEIVTEIRIPPLPDGAQTVFLNLARTKEDCAKVAMAVNAVVNNGIIEDIKIAVGAVAPVIVRATTVENMLKGERPGRKLLEAASRAILQEPKVTPISDIRSSAQYRKRMVGVLAHRALGQIFHNYLNS